MVSFFRSRFAPHAGRPADIDQPDLRESPRASITLPKSSLNVQPAPNSRLADQSAHVKALPVCDLREMVCL
jgi:hypothetical protein